MRTRAPAPAWILFLTLRATDSTQLTGEGFEKYKASPCGNQASESSSRLVDHSPFAMPLLEIPYTVVDAFATIAFRGNPAAVVLLDETTDAALTENARSLLAREFNLPMTAFVVRGAAAQTSGSVLGPFGIRWLTATASEIKLCGHGTVAAAHTLFNQYAEPGKEVAVKFETRFSGELIVTRGKDEKIGLTFPAGELEPVSAEVLQKVKEVLPKAFPKQNGIADAVRVVSTGIGATFGTYVVIEVDNSVDIASLEAHTSALVCQDMASWMK